MACVVSKIVRRTPFAAIRVTFPPLVLSNYQEYWICSAHSPDNLELVYWLIKIFFSSASTCAFASPLKASSYPVLSINHQKTTHLRYPAEQFLYTGFNNYISASGTFKQLTQWNSWGECLKFSIHLSSFIFNYSDPNRYYTFYSSYPINSLNVPC